MLQKIDVFLARRGVSFFGHFWFQNLKNTIFASFFDTQNSFFQTHANNGDDFRKRKKLAVFWLVASREQRAI